MEFFSTLLGSLCYNHLEKLLYLRMPKNKKHKYSQSCITFIKIFLVFSILSVNLPSFLLASALMESSFCKEKRMKLKCCKMLSSASCEKIRKHMKRDCPCPCTYVSQADDYYFDRRTAYESTTSLISALHSEIDNSGYFQIRSVQHNENDLPPPKGGSLTYLINNNFRI